MCLWRGSEVIHGWRRGHPWSALSSRTPWTSLGSGKLRSHPFVEPRARHLGPNPLLAIRQDSEGSAGSFLLALQHLVKVGPWSPGTSRSALARTAEASLSTWSGLLSVESAVVITLEWGPLTALATSASLASPLSLSRPAKSGTARSARTARRRHHPSDDLHDLAALVLIQIQLLTDIRPHKGHGSIPLKGELAMSGKLPFVEDSRKRAIQVRSRTLARTTAEARATLTSSLTLSLSLSAALSLSASALLGKPAIFLSVHRGSSATAEARTTRTSRTSRSAWTARAARTARTARTAASPHHLKRQFVNLFVLLGGDFQLLLDGLHVEDQESARDSRSHAGPAELTLSAAATRTSLRTALGLSQADRRHRHHSGQSNRLHHAELFHCTLLKRAHLVQWVKLLCLSSPKGVRDL